MDFSDLGATRIPSKPMAAGAPAAAPQESAVPGLFQHIVHEAPPIVGGMMGAAVGNVPGAIIGGMAGKAYQKINDYVTGQKDPAEDTALGNAGDIARAGIGQGVAEGTLQGAAAVGKRIAPAAIKLGAQALRAFPNIAEKYGAAVLKDPSILIRAFSKDTMSSAYQTFERYTGLKGLSQTMEESGRLFSPQETSGMLLNTANKIKAGAQVTPQELYTASQAANHLKQAAKFGDPTAASALESGIVSRAKTSVEGALEKIFPEYKDLRMANFQSKAREAFSSILPKNKNMSPNILRTWSAGAMTAEGLEHGNPLWAAALPAVSPAVAGNVIRAGAAAAPLVKGAANIGTRLGAEKMADMAGGGDSKERLAIDLLMAQGGLNPKKSGSSGKTVSALGLPSSWSSKGGRLSLDDLTRIWHEKGIINEEDPNLTIAKLKALAEK